MAAKPTVNTPPPAPLTIADIYYVLFKHKWKIIIASVLGIIGAAVIYVKMPPPYESQAKLQIRYIEDTKSIPGAMGDQKVMAVDRYGDGIMAAEADIVTSLDVAAAAADAVGVELILGKGSTNREVAAMAIKKSLTVDVPKRGNVMKIAYQNQRPEVCQPVLRQVINAYFKKHVEIHKGLGIIDDMLTQQTDQIRSSLTQTEEDLRKLKAKAGIVSLDDARKRYAAQFAKLQDELLGAEVELQERITALKELQKLTLMNASATATAMAAATNAVPATNAIEAKPKIPASVIAQYQGLVSRLEGARKREQDLLAEFTEDNSLVKDIQASIAGLEQRKTEMETANPGLIQEKPIVQAQSAVRSDTPRDTKLADLANETIRVASLQSKVKALQEQFDKLRGESANVEEVESSLASLQRKRDVQESQYKYFSTSLEQARFDAQLGAGKLANISEIQAPSLPYRDTAPLNKTIGMAIAGGIFAGLALAFLLEFVIDQSIRKPSDLEQKYSIPPFLTVPRFARNGRSQHQRLLNGGNHSKALPAPGAAASQAPGEVAQVDGDHVDAKASSDIAPWDEKHQLHPYSGALRDRLVSFFELKGLTHKPKLIALTSCSRGAGVTTLAAGLAASLSETGEGNVLLVDMNIEQGAAHPFYRGKPGCGLADVLEQDKRPAAMVQDKLYMVHGGSADDRLPQILPKRISHLIPKLQASDYDYIIFDMPPITQTSVTPRLAAFMDMVFVVVEDEKTSREWLKQASKLLHESKANLGAVYNKRKNYVPKWLHQEF